MAFEKSHSLFMNNAEKPQLEKVNEFFKVFYFQFELKRLLKSCIYRFFFIY